MDSMVHYSKCATEANLVHTNLTKMSTLNSSNTIQRIQNVLKLSASRSKNIEGGFVDTEKIENR